MQIPVKLKPLVETPNTHNKIKGGRGGGKSQSVAGIIVDVMSKAPLRIICAREVQKSLEESSFASIKDEIISHGLMSQFKIVKSQILCVKTGAKAIFVGLKDHTVDSIKSYKGYHWAWIEEAQSISKKSLDVLIPTLREDGKFRISLGDKTFIFPLRMFIYTYNPFQWDDAINLSLPEYRSDVQEININWHDNPWFPDSLNGERIEAKETLSEEEYARIWEGIPFEDSERAVIPRSKIVAAMKREVEPDGGIVVGADIARFGNDRTVFAKRTGYKFEPLKMLSKKDTQEVSRQLHDYAECGKIIVDDTGVGGGVTDKLRDLKDNVIAVSFGGRPRDKKKYPDNISEMWFTLADMIDDISLPDDVELLQELSSRNYKYTPDERRKVESKEEYKKRTGRRSPDKADAVILSAYNRGGKMQGGGF